MERTLYTDGVEVDASDLTNTEDSKVNEILLTRRIAARYGVIDGLGCSNGANRITVDTGRVLFRNGEVAVLDSPIVGITGASFEAGVSTFVGLRLTEVTSNPKPHEVDPTLFDTRAEPKLTAELFVASDNTDTARSKALKAAIDAELNDANFVLLAEFTGVGNGLSRVPLQNTPLPRSKGGDDPFRSDTKTKNQKTALVSMYLDNTNDQFPIESAEDVFHRSLIGSGIPNPKNPHGTTLTDIGGDAILDQVITKHQREFHANGIIGLESPEGDFADTTFNAGSFAWGVDSFGTVTVHDLLSVDDGAPQDEVLVIQGKELKKGQTDTIPDGVIAPKISFAAATAGLYYIIARWATTEAGGHPAFDKMKKADLDALCVDSDGHRAWLNNAVDGADGERKFYVIGLVQWNGINAFTNLNSNPTITIPGANGDLIYKTGLPAGHPFLIPASMKVLDLRRFGNVTNEEAQKRTIRPDRLTTVIITEDDFIAHAGIRVVSGSISVVGGAGLHAAPGGDNSLLKHLTDFDAFDLFGHRQRIGTAQHGLAQHSGAVDGSYIPINENANNSGFQSAVDKYRQDNLTMTLMKFGDLRQIQDGQHAIADAAAVSVNDPYTTGDGGYVVYRRGVLKNFTAHIHKRPTSGAHVLVVSFILFSIGAAGGTPAGAPANSIQWTGGGIISEVPVCGFGSGAGSASSTNIIDSLVVDATPATPRSVICTRSKSDSNDAWKDLTVTAEFHYTS
jgi:hypothetical protein